MVKDQEISKRLNLLRTSKSFAFKEVGEHGEAEVLSPRVVPRESGVFWVGGVTATKSGREIESVFRIDTNSGGSLLSIYWWIDGKWFEHKDEDVEHHLKMAQEEIFPFDWQYNIELEEDIYHD